MEQKRIELTLTRLHSSLSEKISSIERLKVAKKRKEDQLKALFEDFSPKKDFYENVRASAEVSLSIGRQLSPVQNNTHCQHVNILCFLKFALNNESW